MDITTYIPDRLYAEAKAEGVLVRGFIAKAIREAIERELEPIRKERRRKRIEDHLKAIHR